MPSLSQLTASQVVKLLLIGDSGTAKSGCCASLVKAGYKLHVMDFDNGWESIAAAVRQTCPELIDNVDVEPLRDKYKASPLGPMIDGAPKAFHRAMTLLDKWSDGSKPSEWGPGHVLLFDSLTFCGDTAYAWADALNPSAKDKRQIYGEGQAALENVLGLLTGASFNTNVIVTAHVLYMDLPDGSKKGFPTALGKALSPTIPRYFNSFAACAKDIGGKRKIHTNTHAFFDLKNAQSFNMPATLDIETGMATYFNLLRGPCPDPTSSMSSTPSQSLPKPTPTSMEVSPMKVKPLAGGLKLSSSAS